MSYYDDLTDMLHTCPRCENADTVDEICSYCKEELQAHHDYIMGWRKAYQIEQDEQLRQRLKREPDYPQKARDEVKKLIERFNDDADAVALIGRGMIEFEAQLVRIGFDNQHSNKTN